MLILVDSIACIQKASVRARDAIAHGLGERAGCIILFIATEYSYERIGFFLHICAARGKKNFAERAHRRMFLARRCMQSRGRRAHANRRNQTAELNRPASLVTNFAMPDKPRGRNAIPFPPEVGVQRDYVAATIINEPSLYICDLISTKKGSFSRALN